MLVYLVLKKFYITILFNKIALLSILYVNLNFGGEFLFKFRIEGEAIDKNLSDLKSLITY